MAVGSVTGVGVRGRLGRLLVIVVLALTACVGVPTEQLKSYVDAFEEAVTGGSLIYTAMIPALEAGGATTAEAAPHRHSLGSPVYVRGRCEGDLALYDALLARCKALAAVSQYNQALLLLAQGRTAGAVGPQLQAFYESASSLASLVPVPAVTAVFATAGAVFPAVKAIAEEALRTADAARLRTVLVQGEPQIRALLKALQDDVPKIYDVQYRFYEAELDTAQSDIDRNVNRLKRLVVSHAAPATPALAAERRALDARFDRIFVKPEPGFGEQRLSALGPDPGATAPFAGDTLTEASALLDAIERQVAAFDARVEAWARFRVALGSYDRMLATVDNSFSQLTAASANPFSPGGAMPQLLGSAFTIRDQVREIRTQLDARPLN
jgi:hypothetical protein